MDTLKPDWYLEEYFPYGEGREWEFKEYSNLKSANRNYRDTWRNIMVSFLNASGGVLVLGIRDDCRIVGIQSTRSDIDDFKRIVDGIQLESIFLNDGSHILHSSIIRVSVVELMQDKHILLLSVYPCILTSESRYFMCRNGDKYIRLCASTCRVPKERLYSSSQVEQILMVQRRRWETEMNQSKIAKRKRLENYLNCDGKCSFWC